jgi:hypothetical protein
MCHVIPLKVHFTIMLPPVPWPYKLCFLSGLAIETLFMLVITYLYDVAGDRLSWYLQDSSRDVLKIPHPETGLNVPPSAKWTQHLLYKTSIATLLGATQGLYCTAVLTNSNAVRCHPRAALYRCVHKRTVTTRIQHILTSEQVSQFWTCLNYMKDCVL